MAFSEACVKVDLAPHHQTGKTEIDLQMARFNIDMLEVLQSKTKNNLIKEESDFLNHLINDLQLKYVEVSKSQPK